MEASRNQTPSRTEFQSVDDGIDTQLSPATRQVTPAENGRESDSCSELASTVTSSAVTEAEFAECEIKDDLKQNDPSSKKKKKKKKKKKTNPGSPDTSSDTINEHVQGDHSASTSTELLLIQKAEVDRDGSLQESTGTVSSPFQEGEREDIQEATLSGKKKKKKKKKKKSLETGDFDVSVLSSSDVLSNSHSNDGVPSPQALSSDTTVPEAGEIKSDVNKDPRNTRASDETVSELTLDQQELLLTIATTSGQNEMRCQDSSITPEYNVQGDSSGKAKKKKKRKKNKEVEYNILSRSESGVVLATGITEIERVNLLQVMPEKSCAAGVMQQQSQTRNDAEAITTQADTRLLCVHDVSATAGETVEHIKPGEDSSSTGQALREE